MGEMRTLKKDGKWSRESFRERLKEKCVSRVRQERGNLLARLRAAGSCGIQADIVEGIAKGLVHGEIAESRDSLMTCVEGAASIRPPIGEDEEVRCFLALFCLVFVAPQRCLSELWHMAWEESQYDGHFCAPVTPSCVHMNGMCV